MDTSVRIFTVARRALWVGLATAAASCSVILDFDNIEGLPCDCLPGYVCLSTSQTCVPINSVDDYKSCDINATPNANDQCMPGSECVTLNAPGPRCLPRCEPVSPFVSEVGSQLAAQCGTGRYCWAFSAGVGYCDDGECDEFNNPCDPPLACVRVNNAGVCFATCDIFSNALPCGATGQHCQPVADTAITACLDSGLQQSGQACGVAEGACTSADAFGRGLVCTRPQGSSNPLRTCSPVCNPASGNADCRAGEGCFIAISRIDDIGTSLGICQGG